MNLTWTRFETAALGAALLMALPGQVRAAAEGQPCAAEPTDEVIAYSDVRTCAISPSGDLDIFRFVGAAGDVVRIHVSEGSSGSTTPDPCIDLRRPDGSSVVAACHEVSASVEVTLDVSGEFGILVFESLGDQAMNYNIVIERISPPATTNTLLQNGIQLPLEAIDPRGDMDLYTFHGAVGDLIRLDATEGGQGSTTPDVCLDLRRADGSSVVPRVCGEISTAIETTLDQNGEYTVIVSELGDDQAMSFSLLYTCLFGSCPQLTRPQCTVTMSQASYADGETVTVDTLRLANPGPDPVAVEWKLWLEIPGFAPINAANLGAAGELVLVAGLDLDLGPIPLFTVASALPAGRYALGCRFMDPLTGNDTELDTATFDVVAPPILAASATGTR